MTSEEAGSRWAWTHVAVGAVAVVGVCLGYFLSPSLVVAPDLTVDLAAARAAALGDTGFMRLAGVLGVLGDPVIAVGAFALAVEARAEVRTALGFWWLGACALLFTVVDAMTGFALRPAADAGGFAFVKPFFDGLILSSSFSYGVSAILLGWPARGNVLAPRGLTVALFTTGAMLASASVAAALGVGGLGALVGIGITVTTLLYLPIAVLNLLARRPAAALRPALAR